MTTMKKKIIPAVETALFAMGGLLTAFALSWLLLAAMNFSYGLWHDVGGIGEAIETYGPQNRFRDGFHLTTREQRIELFAGINRAIHNDGQGLAQLQYAVPGHAPQTLLREPEIVHLQDVAHLVNVGTYVGVVGIVLWLAVWAWFSVKGRPLPAIKKQVAAIAVFLLVAAAVIVLLGPTDVFYQLHIWAFPKDHEWFFYYQESLMSTMMYAPVLFGWIALQWTLFAFAMFVLLQYALNAVSERWLLPQRGGTVGTQTPKKSNERPARKVKGKKNQRKR